MRSGSDEELIHVAGEMVDFKILVVILCRANPSGYHGSWIRVQVLKDIVRHHTNQFQLKTSEYHRYQCQLSKLRVSTGQMPSPLVDKFGLSRGHHISKLLTVYA